MLLAFKTLGAFFVAAACTLASAERAAEAMPLASTADFGRHAASRDVRGVADRIADAAADHRHLPFAIVDKKPAQIVLFDGDGRVVATSTSLIGLAPGDHALPGTVGRRPSSLRPFERTAPAGSYPSEPGHAAKGEAIVWVDYDVRSTRYSATACGSA